MIRYRFPLALLLPLMLAHAPAMACTWSYDMELLGPDIGIDRLLQGDPDVVRERLSALDADSTYISRKLRIDTSYQVRNDYAITLIRLGHFHAGLEMLHDIESEYPGLYETASNIGSAYELIGRNEKALYWIKEALRRNPRSHHGSEWIHVRILEAKLAMRHDPDWLRNHTILGVDFGDEPLPDRFEIPQGHPAEGGTAGELREAILYQLQERLWFAKAPDPITADLLEALATTTVIARNMREGLKLYPLALSYQPADSSRVAERMQELNLLLEEHPNLLYLDEMPWRTAGSGKVPMIVAGALLGGLATAIVIRLHRRKRAASA